jgi:hypothetical protein
MAMHKIQQRQLPLVLRSRDIADILNFKITSLAPVRAKLIKK